MTESATLSQAITTVIDSKLEGIYTSLPGVVESYAYKTQRSTVQPSIRKVYLDGTVVTLPVLVNVPIVFPRTGSSGITFPINKGDNVALHFSQRSLERWYSNGGVVEPGDNRKFDISDAYAIPGLYSFVQENIASNNDDLEVHHNGFKIVIKKNGKIQLIGNGDTDLIKVIDDWMSQMKTTKVITGIGLQPFDPTSITAMTVIQTELKKLLV